MLSIPVLVVLGPIGQLGDVPWASRTLGVIVIVAAGTLMVGFGEELVIRGILLTAVRSRYGDFVALLVASLVFALAQEHSASPEVFPAVVQILLLLANAIGVISVIREDRRNTVR